MFIIYKTQFYIIPK